MRAEVRILTEGNATMLARVLSSETGDEVSRSTATVRAHGPELEIAIEASDVVSLRAALNSYLRWTKLALDTEKTMEVIE